MSPGPGLFCQRSCWGAKGAGHYWSNLPLPLWIRPIEEQFGASRGRLQEEPGHCGWPSRRSAMCLFASSRILGSIFNYLVPVLFVLFVCPYILHCSYLQGLCQGERLVRWKPVSSSILVWSVITWGSPNVAASLSDEVSSLQSESILNDTLL